jgi:Mrp family chromosome partitioning ATPase
VAWATISPFCSRRCVSTRPETGPDQGLSPRDRERQALERRLRAALAEPRDPETEHDAAPEPPNDPGSTGWDRLARIPVDPKRLDRNLVITASRHDPAHAAFDVLRTRIVQAMKEHGWTRIGITSPGEGNGKSFTALNLAISLSRLPGMNTALLDMDLRRPSLARLLGLRDMPATADFLRGEIGAGDYLSVFAPNMLNIGDRLALGINGRADPYAAELFQGPGTTERLAAMQTDYGFDIVLYDLPPALAMDDVLAFRPHMDCVLLVVGGGETRARDVREAQRRLGEELPILGVVLNKADPDDAPGYGYGD